MGDIIEFTKKKKEQIKKAIEQLEETSADFQRVAPSESQLNIGVTRTDSALGEKILKGEEGFQKYLTITHQGKDYITFSYREDVDPASVN